MIDQRTFVYAIGSEDGPVKFGITTNLESRLRSLQTGSPQKLELIWVFTVPEREAALAMERRIHEVASRRLAGEWFDIDAVVAFEHLHLELEEAFDGSLRCAHAGRPLCPLRLSRPDDDADADDLGALA